MTYVHPAYRLAWSLNIRPVVRPTIGDRALWSDFNRCHRSVPSVAGIVTHPSTVDPVLYRHSARTLGDSHGKMSARGFYSFAPTAELLTDTAPVMGGTVERGGCEWVAPTEDSSGARWSLDRIGSGEHLRACTKAHGLTVNGTEAKSHPVKLSTYRRWAALVSFLSGATVTDPASQWATAAALVTVMSGRTFTPRPMAGETIIGATIAQRPPTARPRTTDGKRPRQSVAAISAAALDLLATMVDQGCTPKTGRPSNPERVARFAYAEHGPTIAPDQMPAVIAEAVANFHA